MYTITGATGNIGSKITKILLDKGGKVKVIARTAANLKKFVDRGAEAAAGDAEDSKFLTNAFIGAEAIFTMIPPNYQANDFRAYQNRFSASIAAAIKNSGVTYVVNLSSQGADMPEGTGPIKGLHDQEQRLNKLEDVNIIHLRCAYFMENLLMNIPLIKNSGIMGSAIMGDLKFPMIATKDIAAVAADYLIKHNFSNKSIRDLLGQRGVSLNEAATVIGKKIGKPDLKYVQFPYDQAEKGLLQAGLSPDVSRLFVEMSKAFNEGLIKFQRRTPENTTPTSLEEFADFFVQVYKSS
ncbi:MAG: NmrA family NAD(P)-binding protein [Nitrospinota bacterium]